MAEKRRLPADFFASIPRSDPSTPLTNHMGGTSLMESPEHASETIPEPDKESERGDRLAEKVHPRIVIPPFRDG